MSDAERQRTVKGGGGPSPEEKQADEAAKSAEAKGKEKAEVKADAPAPKRRRRKAEPKAKAEETAPAAAKSEEKEAPAATSKPRRAPARAGADAPSETAVVRARARYVRGSARKARLVCDHIRGKSVVEARSILEFAPRAAAQDWKKLLESAVASAEHDHELVGDELRVAEAYADEGPTLRRFRPRAMGRATRIRKRTAHLTITLKPEDG